MPILSPSELPVTNSSKKVGPGSTFVAIQGFKTAGARFIAEAVARGATTIVSDEQDPTERALLRKRYPHIIFDFVDDARRELAHRASAAHGHPSKKLKIIGITGTKGKSTTTHLLAHILRTAGARVALCGGISNRILDQQVPSTLTTPDSDYLHYFFAQCAAANVEYVVMEISSHALSLDRTFGVEFAMVGFTNLGQDHLDFYETMDNYFAAKLQIFRQLAPAGKAVINLDHPWGGRTLGAAQELLSPSRIATTRLGDTFQIKDNGPDGLVLETRFASQLLTLAAPRLMGRFNAYNMVMAAALAESLGVSTQHVEEGVRSFAGTPGRMQLHRLANGARAFVDFAHNPSSMACVLEALRPLTDHLIVVFGCGGDRDKTKRPLMGALAARYGDLVIVTDDNPRTEDRHQIIQDIVAGMEKAEGLTMIQPDRRQAIAAAAAAAQPTSIIALLGKGHEDYYIVGQEKIHFDDLEEISRF